MTYFIGICKTPSGNGLMAEFGPPVMAGDNLSSSGLTAPLLIKKIADQKEAQRRGQEPDGLLELYESSLDVLYSRLARVKGDAGKIACYPVQMGMSIGLKKIKAQPEGQAVVKAALAHVNNQSAKPGFNTLSPQNACQALLLSLKMAAISDMFKNHAAAFPPQMPPRANAHHSTSSTLK